MTHHRPVSASLVPVLVALAAVVAANPAAAVPASASASVAPSGRASAAPAPSAAPAATVAPTEIALGAGVTLPLRFVAPGTYSQGDVDPKAGAPVRNVQISKGFWLAETETTVGAFRRFVAATGYRTEAEKGATGGSGFDGTALVKGAGYTWQNPGYPITDSHPVSLVTYADAKAFAAWLGTVSSAGLIFRLPTEAEWELAAQRATKAQTTNLSPVTAADKKRGPHPVCERATREGDLAFCDLLGNVNEWTEDNDRARTTDPVVDPRESVGERKVLKGGSWFKDPFWARPTARYSNTAGTRNADNGFRVAADVASAVAAPPNPRNISDFSGNPATPTAPSSPFTFFNIVFGGTALGIFGVVIAMFVSGLRRGLSTGGVSGVNVRPGVDGFFVETELYAPNSVLYYTCFVNQTQIRASAPIVGKRTFVFTGGVPKNVRVERIDDPVGGFRGAPPGYDPNGYDSGSTGYQAGAIYGASQSSWGTNDTSSSSSSSSSFGGWPSAY